MKMFIISLILLCSWVSAAPAATSRDLAENAPDRYVVVEGDTLWGIAGRFLKDPWRWGELWKLNREQIKNPNRIYPGDIIVLDRSAEEMRLKLLKTETVKLSPVVRATPLPPKPVPTIPTADIEPFLTKPLVIAQNQLADAPRIVRTQENRVALADSDIAYVTGITKDQGNFWQIFRSNGPLIDPDTKEILGYEANFLGDGRMINVGDVSTIVISNARQEIYPGDYLLPAPREVALNDYMPHPPAKKIHARIIAAYGSLYETGAKAVVTLSKGARDGLEVGDVLAIYRNLNAPTYTLRESSLWGRAGLVYSEANPNTNYRREPLAGRNSPLYGRVGPTGAQYKNDKSNLPTATLPDERYGLLMVFRVFDRAAYALVMEAARPVNVLDVVANP